jgi:hypothetical protein
MAITQLTCVGCGKYFQGDKDLVPQFAVQGSIGVGGYMCSECFALTNALRSGAGQNPMPTPPAGAWSQVGGEAQGAPPTALRSGPTPQRQQIPGAAPTVQTAQGQKAAGALPLANTPPSTKAAQPLRRR